jgi:hypothetical protein
MYPGDDLPAPTLLEATVAKVGGEWATVRLWRQEIPQPKEEAAESLGKAWAGPGGMGLPSFAYFVTAEDPVSPTAQPRVKWIRYVGRGRGSMAPPAEAAGLVWDPYRECVWLIRGMTSPPEISFEVSRLDRESAITEPLESKSVLPLVEGGGAKGQWVVGVKVKPAGAVMMGGMRGDIVRRCPSIADEEGVLVHCEMVESTGPPVHVRLDKAGVGATLSSIVPKGK